MAELSGWTLLYYILEYIYERFLRLIGGAYSDPEDNVDGKVVLITGANSGLGKSTALEMAKRGARVVLACRNISSGQQALDEIKEKTGSERLYLREVDLGDLNSVKKFAYRIREEFPQIHILVCNAGVYSDSDKLMTTKNGFEMHMGINHLSHFLLVNLLLDNLKRAAPSRVVVVASTNQLIANLDLDDLMLEKASNLGFQNSVPYNNSKYANSLFAKELAKRLQGQGVNTYSLCPGLVSTEIFRNTTPLRKIQHKVNTLFVGLTPEQGCESILFCALSQKCAEESGLAYRFCKHFKSANAKLDDNDAKRLWELSEQLVELK